MAGGESGGFAIVAKSIIAFLDRSPASIPIKRGRARDVKNFGIFSFIRIIFLIKSVYYSIFEKVER